MRSLAQKYEYRVIITEKSFGGTPYETVMNEQAKLGWEYVGCLTDSFPPCFGEHPDNIHLVFKREI